MSLFDVFSRRGDQDDVALPSPASDAELIAWGTQLSDDHRPPRRVPLRATPAIERSRRRPLVAAPR